MKKRMTSYRVLRLISQLSLSSIEPIQNVSKIQFINSSYFSMWKIIYFPKDWDTFLGINTPFFHLFQKTVQNSATTIRAISELLVSDDCIDIRSSFVSSVFLDLKRNRQQIRPEQQTSNKLIWFTEYCRLKQFISNGREWVKFKHNFEYFWILRTFHEARLMYSFFNFNFFWQISSGFWRSLLCIDSKKKKYKSK